MTVSVKEAQTKLLTLIQEVTENLSEVEITSEHGSAVLISKKIFDSLQETAYLLQPPKECAASV